MDGDKKIITLYCKTAEEKEEWLAKMTERVKFYQDKAKKKQIQPATASLAVLAPATDEPPAPSPLSRPKKIGIYSAMMDSLSFPVTETWDQVKHAHDCQPRCMMELS